MKRPGATLGGIFGLALMSAVLLCGAGNVPVENPAPQGAMQADLNAGGHNLTNVATMSAANAVVSGTLTVDGTNITPGAASYAATSGTATYATAAGSTGSFTGVLPVANGGTGTNALAGAVQQALPVAANTPGGLAVEDANGAIPALGLVPLGPAGTTVVCEGDSTTEGAGVSDVRQTYPCILSTLGFALNGANVYRWGWTGYTMYSINALNATSEAVNFWTGGVLAAGTGTTSPSALAAPFTVIYAGTNDYFGVYLNATLSTSSGTITGLSRTSYFTDFAGHNRAIAVGDGVSGTGIPAGTTVAAIVSGSSLVLSNTPTAGGTQLLAFTPTPATSTFHTDLANLIANAHADGSSTVIVCTLPPAGNTATPADGTDAQGDFQANRLVYNTYIRGLTVGGGGANPDYILDLANLPEFASFNAAYFYTDKLHPNYAGNQVLARAVNRALMGFVTPSWYAMAAGSESVPDTALSNDVALVNSNNVFSGSYNQFGGFGAGHETQFMASTGTVVEIYSQNGGQANLDLSSQFGTPNVTFGGGANGSVAGSSSQLTLTSGAGGGSAAGIQLNGGASPYVLVGQALTVNNSLTAANLTLNGGGTSALVSGYGGILTGNNNLIVRAPNTSGFPALVWQNSSSAYMATFNYYGTAFSSTYGVADSLTLDLDKDFYIDVAQAPVVHAMHVTQSSGAAEFYNAVRIDGAVNPAAGQTTVNGSAAGTAVFSEPFQGPSFKEVVATLSGSFAGTATYTLPAAFASAPVVVNSDAAVTTAGTGTVVVTGTGTLPRTVVLEGY